MNKFFDGDLGFDLKHVRSGKVYWLADGRSYVLEAKDKKGMDLGSIFGGFMLGRCL